MKPSKSIKKILLLAVVICTISLLVSLTNVLASQETQSLSIPANPEPLLLNTGIQQANPVNIYLFWGDGCPHCARAKPFLDSLTQKYPSVQIKEFEVWYNDANLELLKTFGTGFGFEPKSVPTIFIGEQYWQGFSDLIQEEIGLAVDKCVAAGCVDKGSQFLLNNNNISITTVQATPTVLATPAATADPVEEQVIKIPLFGSIDVSHQSLFISTLLISFIDGFNPCSIWVLSMLLAITLHTGSRKKVLIIGLIFLTVTALVYALFIAGLFTVFTVVSFVGWIQVVVALVALFFALVNIKDYFWYKEGISFTVDEKHKPGIFQRIRKLMDAGDSFWGLVGGTIVLSAGVSLVEFSCTAGFPVLWTNLLAAQKVTALTFILLLIVYMIIYQLDELGIFLVAVFTLRSNKVEEKHGRILKLIGGVLMLALAGVMLIKPSLMSDIGQSLVVFGIAFGVTIVILIVHRVILPKFGINIGSEKRKAKSNSRTKN